MNKIETNEQALEISGKLLPEQLSELIECVMDDVLVLHSTPNGKPHDPNPRIDELRRAIISSNMEQLKKRGEL